MNINDVKKENPIEYVKLMLLAEAVGKSASDINILLSEVTPGDTVLIREGIRINRTHGFRYVRYYNRALFPDVVEYLLSGESVRRIDFIEGLTERELLLLTEKELSLEVITNGEVG